MKKGIRNKILGTLMGISIAISSIVLFVQPQKASAYYVYSCYADNTRGNLFLWRHTDPVYARARVMLECVNNTSHRDICFFRGCE